MSGLQGADVGMYFPDETLPKPFGSQFNIVRNDVFVAAVFHQEASGDAAELCEAECLVQVEGGFVGGYDGVELQDSEAEFLAGGQGVFYQLAPDVPASDAGFYGIAGVADVSAAADVVGVEDVQSDDFAGGFVFGDAGVRLAFEESYGFVAVDFVGLRKGDAFFDDGVPDVCRSVGVFSCVGPDGHL